MKMTDFDMAVRMYEEFLVSSEKQKSFRRRSFFHPFSFRDEESYATGRSLTFLQRVAINMAIQSKKELQDLEARLPNGFCQSPQNHNYLTEPTYSPEQCTAIMWFRATISTLAYAQKLYEENKN